jgi:arylesterase / paraoxonase
VDESIGCKLESFISLQNRSNKAQSLLFIAITLPYLYDRLIGLSIVIRNAPEKLQQVNRFKAQERKLKDVVRNCEDALLIPEREIALISCDPGRDNWNTVMV